MAAGRRPDYFDSYRQLPAFAELEPRFKDLTFAGYLRFFDPEPTGGERGVGPLSKRFVKYCCRTPERTMVLLRQPPENDRARADLFDVRFLHTHQLNEELRHALIDLGYEASRLDFIRRMGKVRPGSHDVATPSAGISITRRKWWSWSVIADARCLTSSPPTRRRLKRRRDHMHQVLKGSEMFQGQIRGSPDLRVGLLVTYRGLTARRVLLGLRDDVG